MALLMVIGGLILLLGGGEVLVRGAVHVATRYRISPMVIGLTIVSLGTSAPELLVSVKAALKGSPDLAIGNVLGSNIANLALVLGCTALVLPIPVVRNTLRIDWPVMMGASLLLWWMMSDLILTFSEGLILIVTLALYILFLFRQAKKNPHGEDVVQVKGAIAKDIVLIVLGCLALVFGADFLVNGASDLARNLGVSEHMIGVTIVAFGTSVPELATSLIAAFKKELDISVGNLIGSNIFNILAILGVTSMVKEIKVNPLVLEADIFWMLGVAFLLLPLILHRFKVHRWKGALLLSIYVAYVYFVLG